ncbi:MAG: hypothetical protein LC808_16140, partial [Actinobacteria bacterium]|nr:hypothetical protein [Actinomycetota bacterium]
PGSSDRPLRPIAIVAFGRSTGSATDPVGIAADVRGIVPRKTPRLLPQSDRGRAGSGVAHCMSRAAIGAPNGIRTRAAALKARERQYQHEPLRTLVQVKWGEHIRCVRPVRLVLLS